MKKFLLICGLLGMSSMAFAAEYTCKVYCKSPDGSTHITVKADSASKAASLIDKRSDQICQGAGHGRSTTGTMQASQCSKS